MKLIIAIVRDFKVTEIVDAVHATPEFPGVTVVDCRGFGREKSIPHRHQSSEDVTDFVDRKLLLVAAPEAQVASVAAFINGMARTGNAGDGKIFVVPLEETIRIATGQRGDSALT